MATKIRKIYLKNDVVVSYELSPQIADKTTKSDQHNQTAVLLLHGLASNMTRWTEFVANSTITEHIDILRMDLRGHGHSMTQTRITMSDWCHDIIQILSAENYSKVIIIGHSLGAQIAMQFAYNYPENTQAIVLIDPVFPQALKGVLNITRRLRYLLLILIYVLLFKAKMPWTKTKFDYRDLHLLDIKTREILSNQSDTNIAELYMNPFDDLRYIPLVNYCQDMFEVTRKVPEQRSITCPVLCLLSRGASISNIGLTQSFVKRFPDNEISIIDADHWLLTEKPLESRNAIDAWCLKILTK